VIDPLLQIAAYLAKLDRIGMARSTIQSRNAAPISLHGPAGQRGD
jgi:hypothetical protein